MYVRTLPFLVGLGTSCIISLAGSVLQCALVVISDQRPMEAAELAKEALPKCEIDMGPCTRRIGDKTVVFNVGPKPLKSMQELTFVIAILPVQPPQRKGVQGGPDGLTIDLEMPGMFMGRNQVILRKTSEGTYTGMGVIPRCPSGKSLWKAAMNIPDLGWVDFSFNVSR